nr:12912_t:CDS:2 [Entrophospora candida]
MVKQYIVTALAAVAVFTTLYITLTSSNKQKRNRIKKKKKSKHKESEKSYVHGLVNQGNNLCFLNSVLQGLASLKKFLTYLRNKTLNPERPVTNALYTTLERLNQPLKFRRSFVASDVVFAMENNQTIRHIVNRQQQDAHELFQLLLQSLSYEDEMSRRPKSLLDLEMIRLLANNEKIPLLIGEKNPLFGLTACRISCMKCEYFGPIRHSTFDNISIPLPRENSTTLDKLLGTFVGIDFINEYNCPRCSLQETLSTIENQLSKVKVIDKKLLEDPIKQTIFANLPQVLVIHLSRSIFLTNGISLKNSCRVEFSEIVDMSKYTTIGYSATMPSEPLSHSSPISPSPIASPVLAGINDDNKYQLKTVIVHQGDHRNGHFVTYRKREDSVNWWYLSDESVKEVSLSHVLLEEAYMLFYEKC